MTVDTNRDNFNQFTMTGLQQELLEQVSYTKYENNATTQSWSNSSDETMTYFPLFNQPTYMIVLYTAAYSIVFFLGILGNSLVVTVVYRNPRMHNVTNYFIVNLAVADILVCLFCLPLTLLSNLFYGK